jgi:hypothetical protein
LTSRITQESGQTIQSSRTSPTHMKVYRTSDNGILTITSIKKNICPGLNAPGEVLFILNKILHKCRIFHI